MGVVNEQHAHAHAYPLNLKCVSLSAVYNGYQHPLDQQVTVGVPGRGG